jgi:UDP-glucose 4-epimerase
MVNRKMKYLITGGAGFIGSNLVKRLNTPDNEIIIVDNLTTGSPKNIQGSMCRTLPSVNEIPSDLKVDVFIHLGMPSSSPMYKANPYLVAEVCKDAITVLNYCVKNKVPLVYASTSSLYNGQPIPWKEILPISPTDYYTEARFYLERLCRLYRNLHKVCSIGLRFFSIYGQGEFYKGRYANLVSQFMWAMYKDERPVVYGDGTQERDFIYVDDVVNAILSSVDYLKRYGDELRPSYILNVGTGISYNLLDMISILNSVMGKNIQPLCIKNPVSNYVPITKADIQNIRLTLGWRAETTLREGIERTYDYYLKNDVKI